MPPIRSTAVAVCVLFARGVRGWKQIRPVFHWLDVCEGDNCSNCTDYEVVQLDIGNGTELHTSEVEGIDEGIRAVKYWPEPIGYRGLFANNSGQDPYTTSYGRIHLRDLEMMRYELGANAVLLGPWTMEGQSHASFLTKAKDYDLQVIPSFDISWYWKDGNWINKDTRESLKLDFADFLDATAERTVRKDMPYTPDGVLMWNVVGLPDVEMILPRKCAMPATTGVGTLAACFSNGEEHSVASVRELQEILAIIRTEQTAFFCHKGPTVPAACEESDEAVGPFVFDRPLALTVELGHQFSLAFNDNIIYLQAFIFWMERVVGCHKIFKDQVEIPISFNDTLAHCRFHGHGFFDTWIFKIVAAASDREAAAIQSLLGTFKRAQQGDGMTYDPGDTSLASVSGVMKPVVVEYGFPAISPRGVMDPDRQHQLLQRVWDGGSSEGPSIHYAWRQDLCVRGAAIDEWVDVWGSELEYNECSEKPSSQFAHSTCGPSADKGVVAVSYTGIMGQFDSFLMHCIHKRVDNSAMFKFISIDAISALKESADNYDNHTPGLCRFVWLRPGVPIVVYAVVMGFAVLFMGIATVRTCCPCARHSGCYACAWNSAEVHKSAPWRRPSDANLTPEIRKKLDSFGIEKYGEILAREVAKALKKKSLPLRYDHLVGHCGWGLRWSESGNFQYHRMQADGLGFGEVLQRWQAEGDFTQWLAGMSDQKFAHFGFNREEMLRADLIGNKTITFSQLVELVKEAEGFSVDAKDSVRGRGSSTLDLEEAKGSSPKCEFLLELKYDVCPVLLSRVARDAPFDSLAKGKEKFMQEVKKGVKAYLTVLASTHIKVQTQRLRRQLIDELEALKANEARHCFEEELAELFTDQGQLASFSMPTPAPKPLSPQTKDDLVVWSHYNIWRRTCESVHKLKQREFEQFDPLKPEKSNGEYFAEALLLRLLESVGEHLVHSPEWLALVHDKIIESQEYKKPDNRFEFEVDYALLYKPLDAFCQNSNVFAKQQGINFDDINDHGKISKQDKADELKADGKNIHKSFKEPIGVRVLCNLIRNYQWPFTLVLWLFTLALITRDSTGHSDFAGEVGVGSYHRLSPFTFVVVDLSWLCLVHSCSMWVRTPLADGSPCENPFMFFPRFYPRVVSCLQLPVLLVLVPILALVELEDFRQLLASEGLDRLTIMAREMEQSYSFVPWLYLGFRVLAGLASKEVFKRCTQQEQRVQYSGLRWKQCVFWLFFGISCFMGYYGAIVELARPLTLQALCQVGEEDSDFCNPRELVWGPIDVDWWRDTQCVACMVSVASVWSLSLLGCLLVPYFLFNCAVAFIGAYLGMSRGLVETLTIDCLDFTVRNIPSSTHRDTVRSEATWLSHGTILQAMYGGREKWTEVWNTMVDGLYEEDLIDENARTKLIEAAAKQQKLELGKLDTILPRAMERIGYLFASHRSILAKKRFDFQPYTYGKATGTSTEESTEAGTTSTAREDGKETAWDWPRGDYSSDALGVTMLGRVPTLTQIIPVYSEDGIMSIKELKEKPNGAVATTLEFLISQFPEEWKLFALRMKQQSPSKFYDKVVHDKFTPEEKESGLPDEVREWASHRAQSVIRTVNGAVHYHKALEVTLEDKVEDLDRMPVQLILAHQTYGQDKGRKIFTGELKDGKVALFDDGHGLKKGSKVRLSKKARTINDATSDEPLEEDSNNPQNMFRQEYIVEEISDAGKVVTLRDPPEMSLEVDIMPMKVDKREEDVHYMLRKHKGKPFFVAIDFERGKTFKHLEDLIDEKVKSDLGKEGEEAASLKFSYASVLIKYTSDTSKQDDIFPIEVVHVLPRSRGLLIGSDGNRSQGKAGNQLGALRFAEGHFLQMMDANMGCYAGEGFKVPVVLRDFYKQGSPTERPDRIHLRARIIGFREHIFTRSHSLVGAIMADAEWTFGTLVQRLLSFLGVRMHYGHPDFMDCFWACNRGSVSKASPHINLSEDIFAGLNVAARSERSLHTDILEWEKGREVQFAAGAGFFWKISSGSVGLMRTRDLRELMGRSTIVESIALFFATVAWYLHNLLVDFGTELYVMLFIYLTFSGKSLADVGLLGSIVAVEWFVTPAFTATLPASVGFGVEYGASWLCKNYLPTVPASMIYFIFINKSMAVSVRTTIWANTAEYVNTGRPHANKSYSMKDVFSQFRLSHYMPAVTLLYLVVAYGLANRGGALPMVMIVATALCWIVAPVLFRPPTDIRTLGNEYWELAKYILSPPPSSNPDIPLGKKTCLYEEALEQDLKWAKGDVFLQWFPLFVVAVMYMLMVVATVWEQMVAPFFAWALAFNLQAVRRTFGQRQAGIVNLALCVLLLLVPAYAGFFIENFSFSSLLLAMVVFVHMMETLKVFCWLCCKRLQRCKCLQRLPGFPSYNVMVHACFDYSLSYQLQIFGAVVVLVMQATTELLLQLLDRPCAQRLRTRALLNRHLASGCVQEIYPESSSDGERKSAPPRRRGS